MVRLPLPQVGAAGEPARRSPPAAPDDVRRRSILADSHGRAIRDLRLSITDRCNFRCVYCMEPGVRFAPHGSLLTADEIVRIARIAESLGIRKIRLTGGEPTLRPDLERIIAGIRAATGVEIALITNGSRITPESLRGWREAGLRRITLSIDTLRPDRFARITRSGTDPGTVLRAAEMCLAAALTPVKLNAVLIRGFNDDEAADLAEVALRLGVEMRFIEYMPLDSAHAWDSSRWVSAAQTRAAIERRFPLIPLPADDPSSTSRDFAFADPAAPPGARVGFIAPISSPFCGACARLRITADGMVRPCLFSTQEWDLRGPLRAGATDRRIAELLIDASWTKQAGHGIESPRFRQPERPMSAIGG